MTTHKKRINLRKGYTTGACAAAAAKAAAGLLKGQAVKGDIDNENTIDIPFPNGKRVTFKVHNFGISNLNKTPTAFASVIKNSGDDPDVTNGIEIIARVRRRHDTDKVVIKGGKGIGVVTKPGLQVSVGESAINPVPLIMIEKAVREVMTKSGIEVEITVPEGEEIAKKTFNSRVGITGGISIIGTTGIVEPMSVDALKETIKCEINVALKEKGNKNELLKMYFAPGKIGENSLKRVFGDIRVVLMSNFIGFTLDYAKSNAVRDVIIGGHPGKLAKILMGYLDTHSKSSPQATGFVSEYFGISKEFNTVEEIIQYMLLNNTLYSIHLLSENNVAVKRNFSDLSRDIAKKIRELFKFQSVSIYLFDMKNNLIGLGGVRS